MLTYLQIVIGLWLIFATVVLGIFLIEEMNRQKKAREDRIAEQNVMDIYESIYKARRTHGK